MPILARKTQSSPRQYHHLTSEMKRLTGKMPSSRARLSGGRGSGAVPRECRCKGAMSHALIRLSFDHESQDEGLHLLYCLPHWSITHHRTRTARSYSERNGCSIRELVFALRGRAGIRDPVPTHLLRPVRFHHAGRLRYSFCGRSLSPLRAALLNRSTRERTRGVGLQEHRALPSRLLLFPNLLCNDSHARRNDRPGAQRL